MRYHSKTDLPLAGVLWVQFRAAGLVPERGPVDQAAAEALLAPGMPPRRWFEESLRVLAEMGFLERADGSYRGVEGAVPADAAVAWAAWTACRADPQSEAQSALASLAETALTALPGIITGQRRATDVLFPDGSTALVEGVYRDNPISDYFNDVIADLCVALIEGRRALAPDARLRILEIGAGTGGTTARVLERLAPFAAQIEEYCFTDLSQAFLMRARQTFGPAHPYLTCQTFNIETPAAAQKIALDHFDIALATNVIHATRDVAASLRNIKPVLHANGVLLINEINGSSLAMHVTFGLLEGWWLHEDTARRLQGSPALSSATWKQILEQEGYQSVLFPAEQAHSLGQQIIAAESNGVVRGQEKDSALRTNMKLARAPVHSKKLAKPLVQSSANGYDTSVFAVRRAISQATRMSWSRSKPISPRPDHLAEMCGLRTH